MRIRLDLPVALLPEARALALGHASRLAARPRVDQLPLDLGPVAPDAAEAWESARLALLHLASCAAREAAAQSAAPTELASLDLVCPPDARAAVVGVVRALALAAGDRWRDELEVALTAAAMGDRDASTEAWAQVLFEERAVAIIAATLTAVSDGLVAPC